MEEANHILVEIPTPESSDAESSDSDDDEIDLSAIKKPEQELSDSEWHRHFLKQISPEVKKRICLFYNFSMSNSQAECDLS